MRIFNSVCSTLVACLLMLSSTVSADVVVHASELQHSVFGGSTIKVSYTKQLPNRVVVVSKLATYWVKPPQGHGRIRITVPMQFYLTSWDVKALELELQRLGVKVKPKPLGKPQTKPGTVVAG